MTIDREDALEPGAGVPARGRRDSVRTAKSLPALMLAFGSVLPAVVVASWVLAAMPLVLFHVYRPAPAIVLGLIVAGVLGRPAARAARARADAFGTVPWWVLAALLAVVVGFGVLAFATSAHDVIIRRDPGSYAMSSLWLSNHGTIQMPANAAAFGGPDPNLRLASQGFYLQGSHIIPQFMTGVPVLMAIGGWVNGIFGVLHMNAFFGAFGLLAFGGLAARLIDVRWAPLAVLTLALVQPQLDVMRATYSEPAAQLILLGGLALVLDALHMRAARGEENGAVAAARFGGPARIALLVGGLVLGLVSVVRIDAIADLLPLVPFVGWLAFHRDKSWRWLAIGTAAGLAVGAFDCLVLTWPYTKHVGGDLLKALGGFVLVVPLTIAGVRAGWASRRPHGPREGARVAEVGLVLGIGAAVAVGLAAPGSTKVRVAAAIGVGALTVLVWAMFRAVWWGQAHPDRERSRHWPALAALGVFLVGLFYFLRPHLMTMRASPTSGGAYYVAQVQRLHGIPIDPTRSYYENSLRWMSWYLGWATLALALGGAMWLAYQLVRGHRREWLLPFAIFLGMTCAVLAVPSITPDHPWADRRFVPVAYPGVILFAFVAVAVAARWIGERQRRIGGAQAVAAVYAAVAVVAAAVIVVPAWWGSRTVFTAQTEVGEVDAVRDVCASLKPDDAVLAFGAAGTSVWPGTIRVMCGVPTASLDGRDNPAALARIAEKVAARGGRLMILVDGTVTGDRADVPGVVDWPSKPTAYLQTTEVGHTLLKRPDHLTHGLVFQVWIGELVAAPSSS